MINSHKGKVQIKGNKIDLLADFSCICFAFAEHDCFSEEQLKEAMHDAFESSKKEDKDIYSDIFDSFMELGLLAKVFECLKAKENDE